MGNSSSCPVSPWACKEFKPAYPTNLHATSNTETTYYIKTENNDEYSVDGTGPEKLLAICRSDGLCTGTEETLFWVSPGRIHFDQSDSSNAGYALTFYSSSLPYGGTMYTDNVVQQGTPGEPGARTTITVNNNTPEILWYQCADHPHMAIVLHKSNCTDRLC